MMDTEKPLSYQDHTANKENLSQQNWDQDFRNEILLI